MFFFLFHPFKLLSRFFSLLLLLIVGMVATGFISPIKQSSPTSTAGCVVSYTHRPLGFQVGFEYYRWLFILKDSGSLSIEPTGQTSQNILDFPHHQHVVKILQNLGLDQPLIARIHTGNCDVYAFY